MTAVMVDKSRSSRLKAVAVTGGVSVLLAGVLLVDPNRGLLPPCPLKMVTGLDCPLCGGTRSVHALLTGDVGAAIGFNALAAIIILPVLAFLVVRAVVLLWQGKTVSVPVPGWAIIATMFVFGVVRNLPFSWAEPLRA